MSISNYYNIAENKIKNYIQKYTDEEILRIIDTGKFEKFIQRHLLPLIERDENRTIKIDRDKSTSGTPNIKVFYPIILKEKIDTVMKYQASHHFVYAQVAYQLQEDNIVIFMEFRNKASIDNAIADLEKTLAWKNSDVKKGNDRIRQVAKMLFQKEYDRVKREYAELEDIVNNSNVPYELVKKEQYTNSSEKRDNVKGSPHKQSNVKHIADTEYEYDFFISHASEDKESFVRLLATELQKKGFKVWYDEFSLTLGDSLREKIDYGLANSCYGIVILSKHFFEKDWPKRELDGLMAKERNGKKVILPIWHGVTRADVENFSLILAGKVGAKTNKGLDYIVGEIIRASKNS